MNTLLAHECRYFAAAAYHMLSNGGSPAEIKPASQIGKIRKMQADLEKIHRSQDVEAGVAHLADVYGVSL